MTNPEFKRAIDFGRSTWDIETTYKPIGYDHEPYILISEKEVDLWMIFVLKKPGGREL